MTPTEPHYDGLTDDEVAAHLASSAQRSDEDHTTWTQRAAAEEAKIHKLIADRLAERTAAAEAKVAEESAGATGTTEGSEAE